MGQGSAGHARGVCVLTRRLRTWGRAPGCVCRTGCPAPGCLRSSALYPSPCTRWRCLCCQWRRTGRRPVPSPRVHTKRRLGYARARRAAYAFVVGYRRVEHARVLEYHTHIAQRLHVIWIDLERLRACIEDRPRHRNVCTRAARADLEVEIHRLRKAGALRRHHTLRTHAVRVRRPAAAATPG
jgi:hypothetical protein